MTKRSEPRTIALPERNEGQASMRQVAPSDRIQSLLGIVDKCAAAQAEAEGLGETFLAYMLAMTIQEARGVMRQANLEGNPLAEASETALDP